MFSNYGLITELGGGLVCPSLAHSKLLHNEIGFAFISTESHRQTDIYR